MIQPLYKHSITRPAPQWYGIEGSYFSKDHTGKLLQLFDGKTEQKDLEPTTHHGFYPSQSEETPCSKWLGSLGALHELAHPSTQPRWTWKDNLGTLSSDLINSPANQRKLPSSSYMLSKRFLKTVHAVHRQTTLTTGCPHNRIQNWDRLAGMWLDMSTGIPVL